MVIVLALDFEICRSNLSKILVRTTLKDSGYYGGLQMSTSRRGVEITIRHIHVMITKCVMIMELMILCSV